MIRIRRKADLKPSPAARYLDTVHGTAPGFLIKLVEMLNPAHQLLIQWRQLSMNRGCRWTLLQPSNSGLSPPAAACPNSGLPGYVTVRSDLRSHGVEYSGILHFLRLPHHALMHLGLYSYNPLSQKSAAEHNSNDRLLGVRSADLACALLPS